MIQKKRKFFQTSIMMYHFSTERLYFFFYRFHVEFYMNGFENRLQFSCRIYMKTVEKKKWGVGEKSRDLRKFWPIDRKEISQIFIKNGSKS